MYKHTVQYYETDKMGITHHSNYIRWMEETRVALLSEMGYGYDKLEEAGIISPVINVNCNYKKTTTFPEVITIDACVNEFNGVKMTLSYIMKNSLGDIVCEAQSSHAFLDNKGIPIRLKKEFPDFYNAILSNMNNE